MDGISSTSRLNMMWVLLFLCVNYAVASAEYTDSLVTLLCCQQSLWGLHLMRAYDCQACSHPCSTAFVQHLSPISNRHHIKDTLRPFYLARTDDRVRRSLMPLHSERRSDGESIESNNDTTTNDDRLRARSRSEWIDGQQMMQILAQEKAEEQRRKDVKEFERRFQRRSFQAYDEQAQISSKIDAADFLSKVSYTDANTLQIEIPSSGVDANTVASGAFSALWFSAVAPATVSMLTAGIAPALFMAPFWLAGGVVAKTAVYDPFISYTLSIGQYLWTLEKKYLKSIGSLNKKREEGSTESLTGASVELAMVVNNVGRYQLRLFLNGDKSITFGKGLALEELEYLSGVINDHIAKVQQTPSP